MPIYTYRCNKCDTEEENISPIKDRDNRRIHDCGATMQRIIEVPCLVIMKQTGRNMALDSLNSKETSHMKPEYKQKAAQGLNEPPKVLF